MNESVLPQLRKAVEQAVRPVQAGPKRRRCIREELFAHLCEVYADEFTALLAAVLFGRKMLIER